MFGATRRAQYECDDEETVTFPPLPPRRQHLSQSGCGNGHGDVSDGARQGDQEVHVQNQRRLLLDSGDSRRDPVHRHRSVSLNPSLEVLPVALEISSLLHRDPAPSLISHHSLIQNVQSTVTNMVP